MEADLSQQIQPLYPTTPTQKSLLQPNSQTYKRMGF